MLLEPVDSPLLVLSLDLPEVVLLNIVEHLRELLRVELDRCMEVLGDQRCDVLVDNLRLSRSAWATNRVCSLMRWMTPTDVSKTMQMERQAKVDANHPDGMVNTSDKRIYGATLEQEECIRAREVELERISAKAELGTQEGREKRTREIAVKQNAERRAEFQTRAASVDPWADPERDDPRAELT